MNFIFFIWLLVLPFYQFSFVGSFSIDNILAPFLFVVWVVSYFSHKQKISSDQLGNISKSAVVAVFYLLSHTVALLTTQGAVWASAYVTTTNMLYFMLPVLYINSIRAFKYSNDAIIIIMFIASTTALLAALGIIEFDFFRQADSRIGEDYLKKSIGVIGSYGDVGLLMSLSFLFVIAGRNEKVFFGNGSYVKIILVIVFILIGIVSMQSRNMILTIMTALFWYWIIGRWSNNSKQWYKKLYVMIFVSIILGILFITLFYSSLLEFIQSVGGTKEAAGTVDDRLAQYSFMWDLVKDRVFVGAAPDIHEKYNHEISLVHNMWLKELVQGGLLSVFAIFILWWRALLVQVSNFKRGFLPNEAKVYISVLLSMLVATQFYPAGSLIFWVLLGMSTAMPSGVHKEIRSEPKKTVMSEHVANKYVELKNKRID